MSIPSSLPWLLLMWNSHSLLQSHSVTCTSIQVGNHPTFNHALNHCMPLLSQVQVFSLFLLEPLLDTYGTSTIAATYLLSADFAVWLISSILYHELWHITLSEHSVRFSKPEQVHRMTLWILHLNKPMTVWSHHCHHNVNDHLVPGAHKQLGFTSSVCIGQRWTKTQLLCTHNTKPTKIDTQKMLETLQLHKRCEETNQHFKINDFWEWHSMKIETVL